MASMREAEVYNLDSESIREIILVPRTDWGGPRSPGDRGWARNMVETYEFLSIYPI